MDSLSKIPAVESLCNYSGRARAAGAARQGDWFPAVDALSKLCCSSLSNNRSATKVMNELSAAFMASGPAAQTVAAGFDGRTSVAGKTTHESLL